MVTILSYLRVDAWPKSPMGGRPLHQVTYGETHGQSRLRVNGHYTKLPTGRRVAKVAYGWTVTTLSHLQVDT